MDLIRTRAENDLQLIAAGENPENLEERNIQIYCEFLLSMKIYLAINCLINLQNFKNITIFRIFIRERNFGIL
jgi:hypothetical protein